MEHVLRIARGVRGLAGTCCLLVWAGQVNNHWFVW
jgi:hypothetical protein